MQINILCLPSNCNIINIRYVAENTEPPAKKTKETCGIKKVTLKNNQETEKPDNERTSKKMIDTDDHKQTKFKIEKQDLKKVPEFNLSDENLTPPVLEPVYPDVKVFFFRHVYLHMICIFTS